MKHTVIVLPPQNYTSEQLEHIKLQDAIHAHENVKADLIAYTKDYNKNYEIYWNQMNFSQRLIREKF